MSEPVEITYRFQALQEGTLVWFRWNKGKEHELVSGVIVAVRCQVCDGQNRVEYVIRREGTLQLHTASRVFTSRKIALEYIEAAEATPAIEDAGQ